MQSRKISWRREIHSSETAFLVFLDEIARNAIADWFCRNLARNTSRDGFRYKKPRNRRIRDGASRISRRNSAKRNWQREIRSLGAAFLESQRSRAKYHRQRKFRSLDTAFLVFLTKIARNPQFGDGVSRISKSRRRQLAT